jgi:nitrate reductase gamma subunit
MVYAALAVFLFGTLLQVVRIVSGLRYSLKVAVGPEKRPKLLGASYEAFLLPTLLRRRPVHWILLGAFHTAFVLLIVGHLELITDIGVLQIIAHDVFLGRGLVGIALLVTILFFLFRRFHSPVREVSAPGDYYILILMFLTVLFGSELHLARRLFGYSTISVDDYREYLSGIFTFKPALPEMFREEGVGHAFLLALHVFCANILLMCFPASRMAHSLLAFPLARLKRR